MKKVLIIANQFPPIGGSGVQRSVKFVKYLRNFGYEPIVLTRKTDNIEVCDNTLLKDVPNGVEIIRTKAYEAAEFKGVFRILGKIISKLLIPDGQVIWARMSRQKALEIIKKENIDLIYTTSAPYSSHLLGRYIKKKIPNIKWVSDFRDEWTNNPYILENHYNIVRTKIEKNMERAVILESDALIANTPVMKENFVRIHNIDEKKISVIPNGYDSEDFAGYEKKSVNNSKFTMVYTGALYGRRKPDTFFEALRQLIEEKKVDGNKIKVKFLGNYYKDKFQKEVEKFNLENQVEIVGYVSHDVCIKYQMSCDVLILIEGNGKGGNAFYTGKLFEYMNTGKPVLAIIPEHGVAANLIRESNIGVVADTSKIEQIKTNIKFYYDKWEKNKLEFKPKYNVIKRYERKKLTENLSKIFDKLN